MFNCPDEIRSALKEKRDEIIGDIADATWDSHHDAFTKNGHRGDEIFTLYHFFLTALPQIEASLRKHLGSAFSVTVSGVVNHGTAFVRSTKPAPQSACELGDIVFLTTYGGRLPSGELGNAAILQAKVSRDKICDPEQCFLYQLATEFQYRDKKFAKALRSLPSKKLPALLFWSFENSNAEAIAKARWYWRHRGGGGRVVHPQMLDHKKSDLSFAEAIFQLMTGSYGVGFAPPVATRSPGGWSEVIDDAISKISSTAIKNKLIRAAGLSGTRGQATPALVQAVINSKYSVSKTSIAGIFERTGIQNWAKLGAQLEEARNYVGDEELERLYDVGNDNEAKSGDNVPPDDSSLRWDRSDDEAGGAFVVIEVLKRDRQLSLPSVG